MFKLNCFSLVLVLALITTPSCSDQYMGNYTAFESAWCVVQGKGNQMAFFTDGKDILKPSESLDSTRFKAGDRYRLFFVFLGNKGSYSSSSAKLVEISNIQPVFVADALLRSRFTGTVNDPVWLNDKPFFGGGYLNFDFQFRSSDSGIKHGIHLLQDSLVNRKIYLRFGHDNNGDEPNKTASALASFPTLSLNEASNADSLIIRWREENGYNTYRIALKDTL
jgi:hypothetical protein